MPWSIFTQGGGKLAAEQWAVDLANAINAPITPENVQFIYDWELAEGGGGKYNPLNQGPVPNHPELTTTGSQFGGGAADYASYQAGIQGAVDYLNFSNFQAVLKDIQANNPSAARSALIASPWAQGHYLGGSAFPNTPLPGPVPTISPGGSGTFPVSSGSGGSGGGSGGTGMGSGGTGGGTATLLSAPTVNDTSISPIGTVLKYLDGFLNPKISAVPSIVNTFTGTNTILSAVFTVVDRLVIISLGTALIATGIFVMVKSSDSSPLNTVLSAARAGTGVGNVVLRGKEFGLAQNQLSLARQREARIAAGRSKIEAPPMPKVPDDVVDAEWWEDVPEYADLRTPAIEARSREI